MDHAHMPPMTATEFLAWEARQDTKWEFDGFAPVAMVGGTAAHGRIQRNLITALTNRLTGAPCEPFGSDIRVPTPGGRYRYPDALVTCTPVAPSATEIAEPVAVFEVLSDSTVTTDRTTKLVEYQGIPSVRHYVMLEQAKCFVMVIGRTETGWSIEVLREGEVVRLPGIGIEVPTSELYAGVAFPD